MTRIWMTFVLAGWLICIGSPLEAKDKEPTKKGKPAMSVAQNVDKATFGAGCFWCTEAVFLRLRGVQSVVSGYAGGHVAKPTYQQVCTGTTGHAECVQVTYDPTVVSYTELLEVFFKTHDPTTLNRQGPDAGTQYRSAIFYHHDRQRAEAEKAKAALDEAHAFPKPIVTQIVPFKEFYPAEDYHQDYFARNPRQPYCAAVVRPKVEKLEHVFRDKLKPAAK
jgi:peptide-methionine (S)-S-oxide reductase